MVVRIPKNYEHLLAEDMQRLSDYRIKGTVSFIDFAPTLAKLAGLTSLAEHDGEAFLGDNISLKQLNQRDYSFSYADRFDERSSLLRSVHLNNYQYIRRYEPFTPDSLFNAYRARQPAYQEWDKMFKAGQLTPVQADYFEPKPAEALYDLAKDPHQINNLAKDPNYRKQLASMRSALNNQVKILPDVGFYPESYVLAQSNSNIASFGQRHKKEISALVDIADLQLQPFAQVKMQLQHLLSKGTTWQKYWALNVASHFGVEAVSLTAQANQILNSNANTLIKARALQFLTIASSYKPQAKLIELIKEASSDIQVVEILNIAAQLKDLKNFVIDIPMHSTWVKPNKSDPDFFHKNSKYNMIVDRIRFLSGEYD
ncbi:hypothetical protein RS130_13320 [Paraglaciecola aquimarina]|uniref:HEAT repeat domain-containing protein n=1 Tax=Paraglaciecola aquimarina TaxID=1235557 RepID=A0ABU3SXR2_9ALTE|nr:hypothetical protein [Paraglaciecola aquimarina]MDU0354767.1 hypothetical protein [Paraglaciecola aquimarina]